MKNKIEELAKGFVASQYLSELPSQASSWSEAFDLFVQHVWDIDNYNATGSDLEGFLLWERHSDYLLVETVVAMEGDFNVLVYGLLKFVEDLESQLLLKLKGAVLTHFLEENVPDLSWASSFDFVKNLQGVDMRTTNLQNEELTSLGVHFDPQIKMTSLAEVQNQLSSLGYQLEQALKETLQS